MKIKDIINKVYYLKKKKSEFITFIYRVILNLIEKIANNWKTKI